MSNGKTGGMSWNDISKYKQQLCGIAIILIIIFHYCESRLLILAGATDLITSAYYRIINSIGVEIFLFVSGVGLYYSLKKNTSVLSFYKRRVKRVLIPYLVFGFFFWTVFDLILLKVSIRQFMLDYSLLSLWLQGNIQIWYVSFILIAYALYPLLYKLFSLRFGNIVCIGIIVIVYVMSVYLCVFYAPVYNNIEIAI